MKSAGNYAKDKADHNALYAQTLEQSVAPGRGEHPSGDTQKGTAGNDGRQEEQYIGYYGNHYSRNKTVPVAQYQQPATYDTADGHNEQDGIHQEFGCSTLRAMKPQIP